MRTIHLDRLRSAASEHEVLALTREYLGEYLPEELGQLPADCRPGKLRDEEDLSELAVTLARACVSFEVDPRSMPLIEEMDAFIGQACRRVAEIQRHAPVSETHH